MARGESEDWPLETGMTDGERQTGRETEREIEKKRWEVSKAQFLKGNLANTHRRCS